MSRLTKLVVVFVLLLVSCNNESLLEVRWGPKPRASCGNWLTFDYDEAIYFHDTLGGLYHTVYNDTSVNTYYASHKGIALTSDDIENLNSILSCKIYCGESDDSVFVALNNPEHLLTFTKENKVVGYISVDLYSGNVNSHPKSKSDEFCALKYFLQYLRR
jgi:hypothetical protein